MTTKQVSQDGSVLEGKCPCCTYAYHTEQWCCQGCNAMKPRKINMESHGRISDNQMFHPVNPMVRFAQEHTAHLTASE
jgi:uncharacterized OB-fold protein